MKRHPRKYVQSARRQKTAQTRLRIIDAVVALHEEVGPSKTTVSAIAERAGVQRLTVYRHFPNEAALLQACSSRYAELNPPPDSSQWDASQPPDAYLSQALGAVYDYYLQTAPMLDRVYRDAPDDATLLRIMEAFDERFQEIADHLAHRWTDKRGPTDARDALRHLVQFGAWKSLDANGITNRRKVHLALRWLEALKS